MLFHLLEWCCRFIRPTTRGRVAPEGEGRINCNTMTKGGIKMFITVDWSLLGNLHAREGGTVKFFQIWQATLASARVKLGEKRCLETL